MKTILRRPEIWALFVIIILAGWWAARAQPSRSAALEKLAEGPAPESKQPESESATTHLLEINRVTVQPSEGGSIVELTLFGRSGAAEPVRLDESSIELVTEGGDRVRRFFLPFEPETTLPADEKAQVTLKYWLKNPVPVLWLSHRDQTLKIEVPSPSV